MALVERIVPSRLSMSHKVYRLSSNSSTARAHHGLKNGSRILRLLPRLVMAKEQVQNALNGELDLVQERWEIENEHSASKDQNRTLVVFHKPLVNFRCRVIHCCLDNAEGIIIRRKFLSEVSTKILAFSRFCQSDFTLKDKS